MPDTAKVALSAATARSQEATIWHPPPSQCPAPSRRPEPAADDGLHDPAARGKQALVIRQIRMGAHLLEIVPGTESPTRRGDHDAADLLVRRDIVERRLQFRQHLLRQGVERAGRFSVSVTTPSRILPHQDLFVRDAHGRSIASPPKNLARRRWAARLTVTARSRRMHWSPKPEASPFGPGATLKRGPADACDCGLAGLSWRAMKSLRRYGRYRHDRHHPAPQRPLHARLQPPRAREGAGRCPPMR